MLATDSKLPVLGGAEKRRYVRGVFTAIAPRYDLLNHLLSLNIDKRWREAAVDALDWERKPDGRYLDLCAGTLDLAAALARRNGFRGLVVGADFVKPMLERGRGKAARVSPVNADALDLPLADASCDGATVGFGVRNLLESRSRARRGGAGPPAGCAIRDPRVHHATETADACALSVLFQAPAALRSGAWCRNIGVPTATCHSPSWPFPSLGSWPG